MKSGFTRVVGSFLLKRRQRRSQAGKGRERARCSSTVYDLSSDGPVSTFSLVSQKVVGCRGAH
jgi:hypothetical protein